MSQNNENSKPSQNLAMILAKSADYPEDIIKNLQPVDTIRETRGLYILLKKMCAAYWVNALESGKVDKTILSVTKQMQDVIKMLYLLEKGEGELSKAGKAKQPHVVIELVSGAFNMREGDKEKMARQYLKNLEAIDAEFEEIEEAEEQNGENSS